MVTTTPSDFSDKKVNRILDLDLKKHLYHHVQALYIFCPGRKFPGTLYKHCDGLQVL